MWLTVSLALIKLNLAVIKSSKEGRPTSHRGDVDKTISLSTMGRTSASHKPDTKPKTAVLKGGDTLTKGQGTRDGRGNGNQKKIKHGTGLN